MRRPLTILGITFFLYSVFIVCSCNKLVPSVNIPQNPSDTTGSGDNQPAITDIGFPAGLPVTLTIGPAGGTVISSDSIVELKIPPGALSTNTDITIQPVTNNCPGGVDLAYDFQPNGLKFSTPATITFHNMNDDVDDTSLIYYYIAYQDSIGEWIADLYNRDYDTAAKTTSLDIAHFTSYAYFAKLDVFCSDCSGDGTDRYVWANQSRHLSVMTIADGKKMRESINSTPPGEDELYALPAKNANDKLVRAWDINGNGASTGDGSIEGTGANVVFQAAARIPAFKDAKITVTLGDLPVTFNKIFKKGRDISFFQRYSRSITFRLVPDMSYQINMVFAWGKSSGTILDNYVDSINFQVDIIGKTFSVPSDKIHNYPPTVKDTGDVGRGAVWVKDNIGEINITGGTAIFGFDRKAKQLFVQPDWTSSGEVEPLWKLYDAGGVFCCNRGGNAIPSRSWNFGIFPYQDKKYSFGSPKTSDASPEEHFSGTVTPIH